MCILVCNMCIHKLCAYVVYLKTRVKNSTCVCVVYVLCMCARFISGFVCVNEAFIVISFTFFIKRDSEVYVCEWVDNRVSDRCKENSFLNHEYSICGILKRSFINSSRLKYSVIFHQTLVKLLAIEIDFYNHLIRSIHLFDSQRNIKKERKIAKFVTKTAKFEALKPRYESTKSRSDKMD